MDILTRADKVKSDWKDEKRMEFLFLKKKEESKMSEVSGKRNPPNLHKICAVFRNYFFRLSTYSYRSISGLLHCIYIFS
jgi:hypothetical protein